MFVMNASFTAEKRFEDMLIEKAKKTGKEAREAEGNISFECWRKDHGETVEYVLVSKWGAQTDFKAWMSRDAHVQEHKEMQQRRKEGIDDEFKPRKKLRSFEVLSL